MAAKLQRGDHNETIHYIFSVQNLFGINIHVILIQIDSQLTELTAINMFSNSVILTRMS